jgi:TonB-linked SusC/RagA family outer membrane protein
MDKIAIRRWRWAFYFFRENGLQRLRRLAVTTSFLLCTILALCQQDKAVSFGADKEPLTQALKRLAKSADVLIGYPAAETEKAGKVSLPAAQRTLTKTLELLLKGTGLSFRFVDGRVVIFKPTPAAPIEEPSPKLIDVSGKVVDEAGAALPGISILLQGTDRGTITNGSGFFKLDQVPEGAAAVAQGVGFPAQSFTVLGNMLMQLSRTVSDLDEVQVIAYGTTTKRFNTGSVTTVKAEDIARQPVNNPMLALQGRVPGLVINQTSGVPGAAVTVQLRGQSSVDLTLSQNNPLIVIDGVPFETGTAVTSQITNAANNPVSTSSGGLSALNSINPKDIESIDVLKDADATSIYGSRGANGVILITTKKGKAGAITVNLNANTGFSKPGRMMPMLNTQQYVQMRLEALRNDGVTPSANSSDPGFAPDITLWDTSRYTDFKKLLIGKTAQYNNIQASISGGNNYTQYRIGGNYNRETTVYDGDFSNQIGSASLSLTSRSTDGRFSLQLSAIYSAGRNKLPDFDLTRYLNMPPNTRLYKDDGSLAWSDEGVVYNALNGLTNPLRYLHRRYLGRNENLSSNLNFSYRVLSSLNIKVNLGYNSLSMDEHSAQYSAWIDSNFAETMFPSAYFANSRNRSWIVEPQINYSAVIWQGKLEILAGYTLQEKSGRSQDMYGSNYQSDLLLGSIQAAGTVDVSNDMALYRYSAGFARINYNIKDRYLINLSGRRDGSSRFGPSRQWATFAAAGVAWIFTEEAFLKKHNKIVSFGKLRGSYGTTGNDQIGDYKFLNLWGNNSTHYNGIPGLSPTALYNPEYNWEVNKKLEAAMELGFVQNRLMVDMAYYRNRSDNQLLRYILPSQTGFNAVVRNFPGLVQNSGWEFSVTSKNMVSKALSWSTSFNLSIPKNVLLSFPGLATSSYASRYIEGKSLTVIRAYKYLGLDPTTGLYMLEDVNNDGRFTTAADYQVFGNLDPKFTGGLQNTVVYRAFSLSFFFQFNRQTGTDYRKQLGSARPGRIINQPTIVLGRWRKPGDISEIQKFSAASSGDVPNNAAYFNSSNESFADASYVKLRNVSLSYNLPSRWLGKSTSRSCMLYLQGQNLATITKYKGSDPETQNFYALPPMRTIVGGIQVNL